MEKRLLSVEELSKYIGLSPQTVYKKINIGNFLLAYRKLFGVLEWDMEEVSDVLNKLALQMDDGRGTQTNLSI